MPPVKLKLFQKAGSIDRARKVLTGTDLMYKQHNYGVGRVLSKKSWLQHSLSGDLTDCHWLVTRVSPKKRVRPCILLCLYPFFITLPLVGFFSSPILSSSLSSPPPASFHLFTCTFLPLPPFPHFASSIEVYPLIEGLNTSINNPHLPPLP